jgi:tetratricopeptide (TPR) repeat protein
MTDIWTLLRAPIGLLALIVATQFVLAAPSFSRSLTGKEPCFTALDAQAVIADCTKHLKSSRHDKRVRASLLTYRGLAHFMAEDEARAIKDLDDAIATDPSHPGTHVNRGTVRLDLDDIRGAEKDFKEAIRIHPGHPRALYGLAQIDETRGDFGSAVAKMDAVFSALGGLKKNRPLQLSMLLVRAKMLFQIPDEQPRALKDYDRILKLDRKNLEAITNRSIVLRRLGRPADALKGLDRGLKIAPNEPQLKIFRIAALHDLGRADEAHAALEQALEEHPDNADLKKLMAASEKDAAAGR